jgi:hypothetical protein
MSIYPFRERGSHVTDIVTVDVTVTVTSHMLECDK